MHGNSISSLTTLAAGFALGWLPLLCGTDNQTRAQEQADVYAQFNAFCVQHFGATRETPHTVTFACGGKTLTRSIAMDRNRELTRPEE